MEQIKNIIFDFDGTLADTSNLIVATMQKTASDLGLPCRTEDRIKSTIGLRLEEIPPILWTDTNVSGEIFAEVYRKNFEDLKYKFPVTLFPYVKETLSKIKEDNSNFYLAVATSRSHKSVEELLDQLNIKEYFDYILGGNDVIEGKPNPESIFKILSRINGSSEDTLMVGDMKVDMIMGKNAGVNTCGVTYGNGKKTELQEAEANFIIESFKDLLEVLT